MRNPAALFAVLCGLVALFLWADLDRWGGRHVSRVAMIRDDLGEERKNHLLQKMHLSTRTRVDVSLDLNALLTAAENDLRSIPASRMRTVALRVAEQDLTDPETGLQRNCEERGRQWERPAAVAVRHHDEKIQVFPAGIRLQGNQNRDRLEGFRLYFRASYGQKSVPGTTFLDNSPISIRKVLLKKEKNSIPGCVNMLAFDVARRVGVDTPDSAPVLLLRNGERLGLALASEHVNRTHWKRRLGHDNFDFYVFEAENSILDEAAYKALSLRLKPVFNLWEYDRVAGMLDMKDFVRAMIVFAFVQWQDWNQGALLRDRSSTPRWKNILWDADLAFAGLRENGIPDNRAGWKNLRDAKGMRAAVFKGLWENSPRFRTQLLKDLSWAINHRLTTAWLARQVRSYAALETECGWEFLDEKKALAYLETRRTAVLQEAVTDLHAPPVFHVRMTSPRPIRIDDHSETTDYLGYYFQGQHSTLTIAPDCTNFSHWIVNGEKKHGHALVLELRENVTVRAVFS